jgi:hypothetical protein
VRQHQLVLRHRSLPAKISTDDVAKSSGSVETNWISHGAIPSFRLIDDVDRALFAAATRVTVRNGSMARLWTMPWVHGNTLAQMFPAFVQAQSTEEQNCGRGNMDPRPNARRYDRYSCRICDALVSQRVDEIVWTRMASGQYSARSAYLMQFQGSLKSDFKKLLIWQVWASSRCKFFVWLML